MSFELRLLGPGDVALLDRVAPEVFDEAVDRDRLRSYLAEPGHHMIVAIADGQVVGQCAAVIHRHPDKPSELYIDEVGVSPAYQRRRIASAMIEAMLEIGRAAGCAEAWVGTEPDNMPARRLYETRKEPHDSAEAFVMYVYRL